MLFNPHVSSLSFIKRGVTIELSIFLITKALYEGLIFLSILEKIFSFDFINFIYFGRDIFFLYTGVMSLAIPIIDKQSALLGVISISIIVSFLVLTIEATSNPNDVSSSIKISFFLILGTYSFNQFKLIFIIISTL